MALRIDSHQQFWRYNDSDYPWIGATMLRQDYLPAHSQPYLRDNGLAGVVAIQARQAPTETDFLLGLKVAHRDILAVVGWTDLTAGNALATLSRYQGKVAGFRHPVAKEPDAGYLHQATFKRGLRMLQDFGFTFDLAVGAHQLSACISLVDEFPEQPFVINHLAMPDFSANLDQWSRDMTDIARRPNVYCKLSGLVTGQPFQDAHEDELPIDIFLPGLDLVLEAFTPARLMFGSDWPVCTLDATFDEVYDIVALFIDKLSNSEQEAIMGTTAARFYGIT